MPAAAHNTKSLANNFVVTNTSFYHFAAGADAIKVYYCDANNATCQSAFLNGVGRISGLPPDTIDDTQAAGENAYGVFGSSSTQLSTVLTGSPLDVDPAGLVCGRTYFMQLHVDVTGTGCTGFAGPGLCYVKGGAFYSTFKVTTGCCGGPGPTPPAPCSATEAAAKNCEALNSPSTCTRYECVNTNGALPCEARPASAGTVCRAAVSGGCDVPESCDGV